MSSNTCLYDVLGGVRIWSVSVYLLFVVSKCVWLFCCYSKIVQSIGL
jgi:hypothetical protein